MGFYYVVILAFLLVLFLALIACFVSDLIHKDF